MQLFVRDGRSVAVQAAGGAASATVADVKELFAAKAPHAGPLDNLILLHNGRQLQDGVTLLAAGVSAGATLAVTRRLRGGGGDGGSTGAESRSCYLEMYAEKKPDKVNPAEEALARATRCRLSGERLTQPCVADELGSLFNKEAVVGALLHKTLPAALGHITSLRSLVTLKLEPVSTRGGGGAAGPGPSSTNGDGSAADAAHFCCPVTGLEMNGRFPFVIHRPSGRVLSERALREVPVAAEETLGCKWSPADLIPVNPRSEALEARQEALAAALAAERQRKAAKKAAKRADKDAAGAGAVNGSGSNGSGSGGDVQGGSASAVAAVAVGSKRGLPPAEPLQPAPAAVAGAAAAPGAAAAAKKLKLPAGATPSVYASIFSSGEPKVKETYLCRGGRKMLS